MTHMDLRGTLQNNAAGVIGHTYTVAIRSRHTKATAQRSRLRHSDAAVHYVSILKHSMPSVFPRVRLVQSLKTLVITHWDASMQPGMLEALFGRQHVLSEHLGQIMNAAAGLQRSTAFCESTCNSATKDDGE